MLNKFDVHFTFMSFRFRFAAQHYVDRKSVTLYLAQLISYMLRMKCHSMQIKFKLMLNIIYNAFHLSETDLYRIEMIQN